MNRVEKAWYRINYELVFRQKRGDEFQDFFANIMEKCYPNDFIRVRAWGRQGDQKNDGYLKSKRMLFQVYAPDDMDANSAIRKIQADFAGALTHWAGKFDEWTFVHNAVQGLSPQVTATLLDLQTANSPLKINNWGFTELGKEILRLEPSGLDELLGIMPDLSSIANKITFADIKEVLDNIYGQPKSSPENILPVPSDKIAKNKLSDETQSFLELGMLRASLVGSYLTNHYDPSFGDNIADVFSNYHKRLKSEDIDADQIFMRLYSFAGGGIGKDMRHEITIYTVLAYLFESCDIFESV